MPPTSKSTFPPSPVTNPAFSLVLPAYNEAARLPGYLAEVRTYLDTRYPGAYEVIVVDDGSKDGLAEVLAPLAARWPDLRILRHEINRGKGAAVRTGILAARGDRVLFADADGATPIREESRLAEAIAQGADVAVGSRLTSGSGVRRHRNWLRGLAGRAFAWLARHCLRLGVRDTQCGFKMFRREIGQRLFSLSSEPGFLFDLEILGLCQRLGYRVVEVPVNWSEKPGGHFRPGRELPRVLADLWRIRRRLNDSCVAGCPRGFQPPC